MGKRSKNYKEDYLYKRLQNSKEAVAYLKECLKEEDPAVFLLALSNVIQASNRSFSDKGNPQPGHR